MWTRAILIGACCLTALNVLAAPGKTAEGAEVIETPAPYQQQPMAAPMSGNMACEPPASSPPTYPWYYWWSTWHWFDRMNDHGQHYAYLPPLPGWYYFRPYSVAQLRAQQEAVMRWGGDPRNPYAVGTLPPPEKPVRPDTVAALSTTTTSATNSYEIVASHSVPVSQPAAGIIPWPAVLCDRRFAAERARIEVPYRRNRNGLGTPTAADYQDMIDAAARMKVTLWQMTAEISSQESSTAEKFLDQLAAEARGQLQCGLATANSEPFSTVPPARW